MVDREIFGITENSEKFPTSHYFLKSIANTKPTQPFDIGVGQYLQKKVLAVGQ